MDPHFGRLCLLSASISVIERINLMRFSKNIAWIVVIVIILVGAFYIMSKNNQSEDASYPKSLEVEILEKGFGDPIENGQVAVVHYTGTFDDGTVFDSNQEPDEPFEFTIGIGRVIQGWDLGVVGMKVGEKRKLVTEPELAYGSRQIGPIPPNSRLTFEVELIEIR